MRQSNLSGLNFLEGHLRQILARHSRVGTRQKWLSLIRLFGVAIAATGLSACNLALSRRDYFRKLPPDEAFNSISLISEQGVDYSALKTFLENHQWQAADQETIQRLLEVAGQSERGWLSAEDVKNLPCSELQTIDQLWTGASRQRFGFTVQASLWEALGGQEGSYDADRVERLGDRVGWRTDHRWQAYESLTFDLGKAPPGHLPATTGNGVSGGVWGGVPSIAGRLQTCGKVPAGMPLLQDPTVRDNLEIQVWQLENKLANQEWQEADFVTAGVVNYRRHYYTNEDKQANDLDGLFCEDLKAVDSPWTTYSNGRFGFSLQQALMPPELPRLHKQLLSGPVEIRSAYYTALDQLEKTVGWKEAELYRKSGGWRPELLVEPPDDIYDSAFSKYFEYFDRGMTYDPPDDPAPGFYPFAIGISYIPERVSGVPVPVPASPFYDRYWPAEFATICPF